MKHSIICTTLITLLLPVAAMAAEEKEVGKSFALSHLTPNLRDACLSDFARKQEDYSKRGAKLPLLDLTSSGDMLYSEPVTQSVREMLFWDGAQGGVAFVVPVKDSGIACFYAVQGETLKFQLSQRLAKPAAV